MSQEQALAEYLEGQFFTYTGNESIYTYNQRDPLQNHYASIRARARREHSRKPDGVHERIERLVAGPYLELFARQKRAGWDCWGNQTDKFREVA